jgi:hypothetical protein
LEIGLLASTTHTFQWFVSSASKRTSAAQRYQAPILLELSHHGHLLYHLHPSLGPLSAFSSRIDIVCGFPTSTISSSGGNSTSLRVPVPRDRGVFPAKDMGHGPSQPFCHRTLRDCCPCQYPPVEIKATTFILLSYCPTLQMAVHPFSFAIGHGPVNHLFVRSSSSHFHVDGASNQSDCGISKFFFPTTFVGSSSPHFCVDGASNTSDYGISKFFFPTSFSGTGPPHFGTMSIHLILSHCGTTKALHPHSFFKQHLSPVGTIGPFPIPSVS